MPQQDYVKAARPAPRTRKKANAPKPLPKLLIAAVLLLLIVFGYFLWHISHRPGAEQLAAETAAALPAKTTEVLDELPQKPSKEPYTYIEELQTKEVQVKADELESKKPATMYCGAFKTLDAAQQTKAKIAFAGLTASIKESSGKFRVVIGPYASRRQAQNDKNLLKRQKIADCWIPL